MWRGEMMAKLNILDLWEEEENKIMLREEKSRDQERQKKKKKILFFERAYEVYQKRAYPIPWSTRK